MKVCVNDNQFFVDEILYLLDSTTNGYERVELIFNNKFFDLENYLIHLKLIYQFF